MSQPVNVFHRDPRPKAAYRVRDGRSFVPRDGQAYQAGAVLLLPEGFDEERGFTHVLERLKDQSAAAAVNRKPEQGRDDATGKRTRAIDTRGAEDVAAEQKADPKPAHGRKAQVNRSRKGGDEA